MPGDLTSPLLIHLKGWLFVAIGVLASGMILADTRSLRIACLLAVAVWAFCRAYYYAFYVIEKYVDPSYKFAGLGSFVRWWFRRQ